MNSQRTKKMLDIKRAFDVVNLNIPLKIIFSCDNRGTK